MTSPLFEPTRIGDLTLPNRIVMPPLTRARAAQPGNVPTAMNAAYYAQRASAGLIIAEATDISADAKGYSLTPGVHSAAQIAGWKLVTDAVHRQGGRIFLQIWHCGRMSHVDFHNGALPVAPSAVAFAGQIWKAGQYAQGGMVACPTPRALETAEIAGIVADFRQAALNAIEAGFDGVEIHAANGYLIDQFLRDGCNQRTDAYGGSVENRARFLFEVLTAVSDAIGSDRVGVRLSPLNSFNSMIDSDPVGLTTFLADKLNSFKLAYLHLMRADFFGVQKADVVTVARTNYKGVLIGNMGYSAEEAEQAIKDGKLDAVAFGNAYIANPDLPERVKAGAALNTPDSSTYYTPGAKGYTDYPTM